MSEKKNRRSWKDRTDEEEATYIPFVDNELVPEHAVTMVGIVKLRETATLDGHQVRLLYKGTRLKVLSLEGDWTKVRYIGLDIYEGYVQTRFIQFE